MNRQAALAVVVLLALVGFALRLFQIDAVSFRGDEAFTALNWVQRPLIETLNSEIVVKDPQPPLAIAAFRGWALLFGVNEFSLRLLPTLANLIGVPVLYVLGKRIGGRRMGLVAALLWAIHPLQIWHAQDARNYALWSPASAAALWLAVRALDRGRWIDWALYVLAAVAACYLYYLELFAIFVLNLFVLIAHWGRWKTVRTWLFSQVVIGLALAPWFLQSRLLVGSGYGGTTFGFDPPRLLTWFLPTLAISQTVPENLIALLWPLNVLGLTAGLIVLWRHQRRFALLLGLMGTIPLILLGLVSTRLNVFTPRYVLLAAGVYALLFASFSINKVGARKSNSPALWWLSLLPIPFMVYSLSNYYFSTDYTKAPDWRMLTSYLHEQVKPGDLVIQTAADEAFTYYYADFTSSERLPANPFQSETEIIGILERKQQEHNSMWLVANPPVWPNAAVAADWLAANMQRIRSANSNGLPAQQFMNWQVRPDEIERQPLATFDSIIELVGTKSLRANSDDDLTILLYWQPLKTIDSELKFFVHLVGALNPATGTPLWAQDDQFPQDRRLSSQTWIPRAPFRDVYHITTGGLPNGEYDILAGLYDPDSNTRLTDEDGNDSYRVGSITIE